MGLPDSMINGFAGRRVEPYREGMMTATRCEAVIQDSPLRDASPGMAFGTLKNFSVLAGAFLRISSLGDRKSTRLNSSHLVISYAVFCLKKKKKKQSHVFSDIIN